MQARQYARHGGIGLFLCILFLVAQSVQASVELRVPTSPKEAVISPDGGILTVEETVSAETHGTNAVFSLVLPAEAADVRVAVSGRTIVRQEQEPCLLAPVSARAKTQESLAKRLQDVRIQLKLLEQRLALWLFTPKSMSMKEAEEWDAKKNTMIPPLLKEQKECQLLEAELVAALTKEKLEPRTGTLLHVTLAGETAGKIAVRYTYRVKKCGWKAQYAFSINPEEPGSAINVRLMANVWQTSGIDWQKTKIALVTGTRGQRTPPALRPWILQAREPVRRSDSNRADTAMFMEDKAAEAPMGAARQSKSRTYEPSEENTSGIFARWDLPLGDLPEGRSTMLIKEDAWKDPLVWIARPGRNEGLVFVTATHTLKAGEVWPDGNAVFMVSGQNTGEGRLSAQSGEILLSFGNDPRVALDVVQDKRKQGESGFLGREKNWYWGWEYVLKNSHKQPVTVRIERPEAQCVQDKITVTYANKPEAKLDSKKHCLSWTVTVPGGGTESVHHALTIKAPESLPFTPVVP